MAKKTVLAEVEAATGKSRGEAGHEDETQAEFVKRLAKSCARLPEKGERSWESLSKEAQAWSDAATNAINDKEEIPLPAGMKPEKVKPADKPKTETKPAAEKTAEKPAAETKKKDASNGNGIGKVDQINELVLRNPKMKSSEILAKLKEMGVDSSLSSVQGIASTVRSVVQTAQRIKLDVLELEL